MSGRMVRIVGTGKYVPPLAVADTTLEEKLYLSEGWIAKHTGVRVRHYAEEETQSEMAAKAVLQALRDAGLTMDDIDCIVGANGVMEQALPGNAVLTKEALGVTNPLPAFDVHATCLSFVAALDAISYMIDAGRYNRVVIFSSDIASVGLDWSHKESCTLFGDAAAAVVLERESDAGSARILAARMDTHIAGARLAEIRGGGTKLSLGRGRPEDGLFRMAGEKLYRLSLRYVPTFYQRLLEEAQCSSADIDLLIPHQASLSAMRHLQKALALEDARFMVTIDRYGNTIAASIPLALHEAITAGRLKRGDRAMLLGTAAGLSVGGLVFVY